MSALKIISRRKLKKKEIGQKTHYFTHPKLHQRVPKHPDTPKQKVREAAKMEKRQLTWQLKTQVPSKIQRPKLLLNVVFSHSFHIKLFLPGLWNFPVSSDFFHLVIVPFFKPSFNHMPAFMNVERLHFTRLKGKKSPVILFSSIYHHTINP